MEDCKIEQRVNIKFLVKLRKSATETFHLLKEVYGEDCLSRTQVFEWHKRFAGGRTSVNDDDHVGRTCTAISDINIEKVRDVIQKDRRLGVRAVAEEVGLARESVRKILTEELHMRKVCAKMVPKVLTEEQRERRKTLSSDLLQRIADEPDLLKSVITCDETWIFTYDPETKRQSMQWKTPSSPRPKKARMSPSKFKAMLIVFFDIQGIVMAEWVPSGQTVNQYYYIEVLKKLRERVRKKRPDLWRDGWILHQDNAPAHNALSVKQFLAEKNITVLEHPAYSPDLAPCDFYLFPKIKSVLKGTHFLSIDEVKSKTAQVFRGLTVNDLQNCFERWQHRLQLCVNSEGNYFEGDRS
jgi:histone-lysine N-methyltransferase SETMAR